MAGKPELLMYVNDHSDTRSDYENAYSITDQLKETNLQ